MFQNYRKSPMSHIKCTTN